MYPRQEDMLADAKSMPPQQRDALYAEMFAAMLQDDNPNAPFIQEVLSWLLFAQEPLSSQALLSVLAMSSSQMSSLAVQDIPRMCHQLVVLDEERNIYQFAHTTVQEYVSSSVITDPLFAHLAIAQTCLQTCTEGPDPGVTYTWTSPVADLYSYSAIYWPLHLRAIKASDMLFEDYTLAFVFAEDGSTSSAFTDWLAHGTRLARTLPAYHSQKRKLMAALNAWESPLFVACGFGFPAIVKRLAQDPQFNCNIRNATGHTGLYLAARNGHDTIVDALLSCGAASNTLCGRQGSALHAACFYGHRSIIQALLAHKTDPLAGVRFSHAAEAALSGRNKNLALLVIQEGPPLPQEFLEPLIDAASAADANRVLAQLRPRRTQQPSAADLRQKITDAISEGKTQLLEGLIRYNPNAIAAFPANSLAIAASYGQEDSLDFCLFLGHRIRLEARGPFGTALRTASLRGYVDIVERLLFHGVDIFAKGRHGDALHAAASANHPSVVEALVRNYRDYGDPPALRPQAQKSLDAAVGVAVVQGHAACVRKLLEAGAKASDKSLEFATQGGYLEVVELLLTGHGLELGEDAVVVPSGGEVVSRARILPRLIGVETRSPSFSNVNKALEEAIKRGFVDIVRYFLRNRGRLGLRDEEVRAALLGAKGVDGAVGVVSVFLDEACDVARKFYWVFLEEFAQSGTTWDLFQLFLTYNWGGNENSAAHYDLSGLLHLAATVGEELFKSWFAVAAPHLGDHLSLFDTVLGHSACWDNCARMMHFLLDHIPSQLPDAVRLLFRACCAQDDEELVRAVYERFRQYIRDNDLADGIVLASSQGHVGVVEALKDSIGYDFPSLVRPRALLEAASMGYVGVLWELHEEVRTFDWYKDCKNWALILASSSGKWTTCQFLISFGADPNCMMQHGTSTYTPLLAALTKGLSPKDVAALGNSGSAEQTTRTIFTHDSTAVFTLAMNSKNQLVLPGFVPETTIQLQPAPLPQESFHHRESRASAGEIACQLNPNSTPRRSQNDTVLMLLGNGASPNFSPTGVHSVLLAAVQNRSVAVVRSLIESGLRIPLPCGDDFDSFKPVFGAIFSYPESGLDMLKLLLEAYDEDEALYQTAIAALLVRASRSFWMERQLFATSGRRTGQEHKARSEEAKPEVIEELALWLLLQPGRQNFELDLALYDTLADLAVFKGMTRLLQQLLNMQPPSWAKAKVFALAAEAQSFDAIKVLVQSCRIENSLDMPLYRGPLEAAISHGKFELVNIIIDTLHSTGFTFDRVSLITVIRAALTEGNIATAMQLLTNKPDPNMYANELTDLGLPDDHSRETSLTIACRLGNDKLVRLLLRAGSDLDELSLVKISPLQAASGAGCYELVQLLEGKGASVNAEGDFGNALHLAACHNHLLIIEMLLGLKVNPTMGIRGWCPLIDACVEGHLMVAKILLRPGILERYSQEQIQMAFLACCEKGHTDIADLLLETTTLCDRFDKLWPDVAQHVSDEAVLRLILDYIIPDIGTLEHACKCGNNPLVDILLEEGIDPHDQRTSVPLLTFATAKTHPGIVSALISHGISVPEADKHEKGLLFTCYNGLIAQQMRKSELVPPHKDCPYDRIHAGQTTHGVRSETRQQDLVKRGKARTYPQRKPSELPQVSPEDCHQVFQLLLAHGAKPQQSSTGEFGNLLHMAISLTYTETVKLCIDSGFDLNASAGLISDSPIIAAVSNEHVEGLRLLLSAGADPNQASTSPYSFPAGSSPLAIARRSDLKAREEIVELLLSFGARDEPEAVTAP